MKVFSLAWRICYIHGGKKGLIIVDKVTNQDTLAEIVLLASKIQYMDCVCKKALEKISDPKILTVIIKTAEERGLRELACEKMNHDWNGCKCNRCGKLRNKQHRINDCKCSICGKEIHNFISHDYEGESYYSESSGSYYVNLYSYQKCTKCGKKTKDFQTGRRGVAQAGR